jgi:hypothetical protein
VITGGQEKYAIILLRVLRKMYGFNTNEIKEKVTQQGTSEYPLFFLLATVNGTDIMC